jgi:hypothetical protein
MGWREAVLRAVKGFFTWNTRTLVRMTLRRVGVMRLLGMRARALQVMESVAGLTPEDFAEPAHALAKLRERFSEVDPEMVLLYLLQMTTFMVDAGRADSAAALLEADTGVESADYQDPARLAVRVRSHLAAIAPPIAYLYFINLANVVGFASRPADELAILEGYFGLKEEDYTDAGRLMARLEESAPGVPPFLRRRFGPMLLAAALGKAGRTEESDSVVALIRGAGAEKSSEDFVADPLLAPGESMLLGGMLKNRGENGVEIALLEEELQLTSADYSDSDQLARKLRRPSAGLPPEHRAFLLQSLLRGLLNAKREQDALAVIAADAGIARSDLRNPTVVAARLRARCLELPESFAAIHLATAAFCFERAGLSATGSEMLTADADLAAVDWHDMTALAARLEARLGDLAPFSAASYVGMLISSLQASGREDRVGLLVDAYLRGLSPLAEDQEGLELSVLLCDLYEIWLGAWGEDASRQPLAICAEIVPYLRRSLAQQGTTLNDRETFIRSVSELRQRIVQTGLFWAEKEMDADNAHDLRRQVLLWDFELGQRLLVERFLLTEIRPLPAGQMPSAGVWPLPEPQPSIAGYRRPRQSDAPEALGALGRVAAAVSPDTGADTGAADAEESLRQERPELYSRIKERLLTGVDAGELAAALGPRGVLLRATFDAGGRLLWSALTRDEGHLAVAAHGAGRPGDLERLRWATAVHDFRLGVLWWAESLGRTPILRDLRDKGRAALAAALAELSADVEATGVPFAEDRLQELTAALAERSAAAGLGKGVGGELLRLLSLAAGPLGNPASRDASAALSALRIAERSLTADREPAVTVRSALDRATADYLRWIADFWSLDPLAAVLSPESEVVVQADDALHAVPFAWLPVRGRPLHQRVTSLRCSLAPLMDGLQAEIEDRASGEMPRRLLSLSWFAPRDAARPGGLWLHHGQLRLAELHGCEGLAGADGQGGSVGALRAALDQGGLATAAICGHGDFERAGIVLGGNGGNGEILWQGGGCDLSGAEWLLLVSCSIGRVRQGGDLDVEGFCVQLAAHRARSVLACRWPVSAAEAAAFASEVTHQYLELRKENPGSPAGLRARALARARRRLAGRGVAPIGLNTAAAFELYGLG